MSKGTILHVISSLDPAAGGVAQAVRLFAAELQKNGYSNEIVTVDAPDAPWFAAPSPVPVHALGPGKYGWAYSSRLLPWLRKNAGRFEAIVVHGLWLYPSHAARRALPAGGPRLYVMPHGMLDPYFQRTPDRRLKAIRNNIYWFAIEHRVIDAAAALLFTCDEEMRLARESFRPYRPKREITVGLGIQEPPRETGEMRAAFARRCPGWKGENYLLFLGRIHPKKGVDLLLRSYAKLRASVEGSSAMSLPGLVIAGPCHDPDYLCSLKDLSTELGLAWTMENGPENTGASPALSPSVHFVEMLAGAEKWGAIYGSEAFVLPSHQENFGIAVAEALACGKPVLLSDKVNIWREIEASAAGLVAEDTLEDCCRLLERWTSLPAEDRRCLGENGKRLFADRYRASAAAQALAAAITTS